MTVSSATTAAVAPPLVPSSKKDEPSKFTISVETPYSKAFTTLTGRASPINKAEETTYKFLKEITEQSKYEKPDYSELNKLLDSLERLYLDKVPPILLEADKLASKEVKQFLNESKSYTNTLIKKSEKPVKSGSWIKMLGVSLLISSVVFGASLILDIMF